MTGKWHLGGSQLSQLPTGRGFDEFVGVIGASVDSYTKQVHLPGASYIDWIHTYGNNQSFRHYAEARHSTLAITMEAQRMVREHSEAQKTFPFGDPLFLYVSYTAAHSPLVSDPAFKNQCSNLKHYWRRIYCEAIVGLDEAIHNLTATVISELSSNTVLFVLSDNGND